MTLFRVWAFLAMPFLSSCMLYGCVGGFGSVCRARDGVGLCGGCLMTGSWACGRGPAAPEGHQLEFSCRHSRVKHATAFSRTCIPSLSGADAAWPTLHASSSCLLLGKLLLSWANMHPPLTETICHQQFVFFLLQS